MTGTPTYSKARLPVFSGKRESWPAFKRQFMALALKNEIRAWIITTTNDRTKNPTDYEEMNEHLDAAPKTTKNPFAKTEAKERTDAEMTAEKVHQANRAIFSDLMQCLHVNTHKYLVDASFGHGAAAWAALLDEYERPSKASKRAKMTELFTLEQGRAESISDFVFREHSIIQDLESFGFKSDEEMTLTILLKGLRPEYATIKTVIDADDSIDLKSAELKLKNYDEHLNMGTKLNTNNGHHVQQPRAFATTESCSICRGSHQTKNCKSPCRNCRKTGHRHRDCPNRTETRVCFRCNKPGHISTNCNADGANITQDTTGASPQTLSTDWLFMLAESDNNNDKNTGNWTVDWIMDSGATSHFCNDRRAFTDFEPAQGEVLLGKKSITLSVKGIGRVGPFRKVKYVPDLDFSLMSIRVLLEAGHSVAFRNNTCVVRHANGKTSFSAPLRGDLFRFTHGGTSRADIAAPATTVAVPQDVLDLHANLGHISFATLEHANKNGLFKDCSIPHSHFKNIRGYICPTCAEGKTTKKPMPKKASSRAVKPLQMVFSDLVGPVTPTSIQGNRYCMPFLDDCTKRPFSYFFRVRSEAFDTFKQFLTDATDEFSEHVEAIQWNQVKAGTLRTDNAGELTSARFEGFLRDKGIKHQTTVPGTSVQNPCERLNRTLFECARCLIIYAKLPKDYWEYAVAYATHIRRVSPSRANPDNISPHQKWKGTPPNVSYFHPFGCDCYVVIPQPRGAKMNARAQKAIFVGIAPRSKGYLVYFPDTKKEFVRRDVRFDDHSFTCGRAQEPNSCDDSEGDSDDDGSNDDSGDEDSGDGTDGEDSGDGTSDDGTNDDGTGDDDHGDGTSDGKDGSADDSHGQVDSPPKRNTRYTRSRAKALVPASSLWSLTLLDSAVDTHITNPDQLALASVGGPKTPKTYWEAIRSPEAPEWKEAMRQELSNMEYRKIWIRTPLPAGKKSIGCVWSFKNKRDAEGKIVRRKARLCAQGFSQREGIDFDQTFSPVVRIETVRVLLAIVATKDLHLHQWDFETAFLNGILEETIYMRLPQGTKTNFKGEVLKLLRSIYGLKQAARVWYQLLKTTFAEFGFTPTPADPCLFLKKTANTWTACSVSTDDLLVASNSVDEMATLKKKMASKFRITDMGNPSWFLGMHIQRNRSERTLKLSQQRYVQDLLEKYNMTDCKTHETPYNKSVVLSKSMCPTTDEEKQAMAEKPYRSLIGAVLHLSNMTRSDIAETVSTLSRFVSNPGQAHWTAAKRLLRYLKKHAALGPVYGPAPIKLIGHCDSDYARNPDNRRSTTGHICTITDAPVAWNSRLQPTIAQSTAEAEYMSASDASNRVVWFRQLLKDLGYPQTEPTPIRADNKPSIAMSENPVLHKRSKHIDIKFHVLRQYVNDGKIKLVYCPTEDQRADILTKPLATATFIKHRDHLLQ